MLITKYRSRPLDAGAREVAALHDDRRVEVAGDLVGDLDVRHPGNGISGPGAGSLLTRVTSLPSARSA